MKTIGFITNLEKDPELSYTEGLIKFAQEKGCRALIKENFREKIKYGDAAQNTEKIYENADFLIVLGGDGTILRAARKAAGHELPILGVNIGTLGYLADVERNDAYEAIEKILDYDYKIEKRMMLEAFVEGEKGVREKFFVLNEVVVSSSVFSRMIEIKTEVNGDFLDSYRADGIIVATPTGSTAYNLSAGGPILKPDTELTAITYVCPHALFSRPFVVSGNDTIRLSFRADCDNAIATFDGQKRVTLERGESVMIKKADYYTNIIRTSGLSFYDILRRKMVEVRK